MTARDRFTSNLECPECGKTGTAHLSQADGWSYMRDRSTSVDDLPEGFRAKRVEGIPDLEFYCIACDVEVKSD